MSTKEILKNFLRKIGILLPDLPIVKSFGNRILWPIHRYFNLGGGVVDVLGVNMYLDPYECVDRNLWFTPHLYDKREINFALKNIPYGGIFIDVGANIGFWSLRVASKREDVKVLAIEANKSTAAILEKNININMLNINISCKGVSGRKESRYLFCADNGNRGGDSFVSMDRGARKILIKTDTLNSILEENKISHVDFLKIDIEGMERIVFEKFFKESHKKVWPKYMCVELSHDKDMEKFFRQYGYILEIRTHENGIFKKEP